MIYCPECDTNLDLDEDEIDEGEIVSCPECGSDFEVTTLNPIELKPVEDVGIELALRLETLAESFQFAAGGQPSVPQQVAGFLEVRVIGQGVDVDAAIS
jgi:alpha-aminoadipate carrier protein LysW